MQPAFTQEFLKIIVTQDNKHIISDGFFRGVEVSENSDGSHKFSFHDKEGAHAFDIDTNDRNLNEKALTFLFIDHVSKKCAQFILNAVLTKKSRRINGEQLRIRAEHLPICLKVVPDFFYVQKIIPGKEEHPFKLGQYKDIFEEMKEAKAHWEEIESKGEVMKEILLDCICFDTISIAKEFRSKFPAESKDKEIRFNQLLKEAYQETSLLIADTIFKDKGTSENTIRYNTDHVFGEDNN